MAATVFCGMSDMIVDGVISVAVRPYGRYGKGPLAPANFLVMYLRAVALYNTATDAATAWAKHAARTLSGMLDLAGTFAVGADHMLDEEHHLLVKQLASDAFLGDAEPLDKVFKASRRLKGFGVWGKLTAILDFVADLEPALAVTPTAPALALSLAPALALPPAPAPAPAPASAPANAAASPPIAAARRADERDPDWTLSGKMRNHTVEQLQEQLERFRVWSKAGVTRSTEEKEGGRRWYKTVHQSIKRKERSKAKAATKLRASPTAAPHPIAK